jgi:hypothetical protein
VAPESDPPLVLGGHRTAEPTAAGSSRGEVEKKAEPRPEFPHVVTPSAPHEEVKSSSAKGLAQEGALARGDVNGVAEPATTPPASPQPSSASRGGAGATDTSGLPRPVKPSQSSPPADRQALNQPQNVPLTSEWTVVGQPSAPYTVQSQPASSYQGSNAWVLHWIWDARANCWVGFWVWEPVVPIQPQVQQQAITYVARSSPATVWVYGSTSQWQQPVRPYYGTLLGTAQTLSGYGSSSISRYNPRDWEWPPRQASPHGAVGRQAYAPRR